MQRQLARSERLIAGPQFDVQRFADRQDLVIVLARAIQPA